MFTTVKQLLNNYLGSEKAMASLVILIGATVFTLTGKMSISDWKETSLWVLGIYTAGKTVQGAASALKSKAETPEESTPISDVPVYTDTTVTSPVVAVVKSKKKK